MTILGLSYVWLNGITESCMYYEWLLYVCDMNSCSADVRNFFYPYFISFIGTVFTAWQ